MASSTHSSEESAFHPVLDRVLYIGNVPLDTTSADLAAMFDICLGSNSLAFLQYPYDAEARCHKGFAFAMLNRGSDVGTCLSKKYRSWFYVEGKRSQGGFNAEGRCYVRIRSARVEPPTKKEVGTELIFSPVEEGVGLRDFKLLVEDVVRSLHVKIVKSEGVLDGRRKYVHIHTVDAESAAAVKMFCHQFKENDMTLSVRFAKKAKAPKNTAAAPAATAAASTSVQQQQPQHSAPVVLEPITENYSKFGIAYSEAVKVPAGAKKTAKATPAAVAKVSASTAASSSNVAVAAPASNGAKVIETSAATSAHVKMQKGKRTAAKGQRLAGTA